MMKEFYRLFTLMKDNPDQKYALATVVHVNGSSYRKEGAKMLIGLDGSTYGMISGGCLEEDLYYRAIDVIHSSQPKTVTYDLMSEDDLGWGQGAGCNGIIDVYVEPFYWLYQSSSPKESIYLNLAEEIKEEKQIIGAINVDSAESYYYTQEGKLISHSLSLENLTDEHINELDNFIQRNLTFESAVLPESNQTVIFEKYEPKEHLYVFGAGPDAEPLVEFAAKLDFSVRVIDPRENRCNAQNFHAADSLIVDFPSGFFLNHDIDPESYVIIMTHNFERDQDILQRLMNQSLKYLGILGPRKRTRRLLSQQDIPKEVHSPIGLDIEAEGAEEISFSILAEMIKVRNAKVHHTVQL